MDEMYAAHGAIATLEDLCNRTPPTGDSRAMVLLCTMHGTSRITYWAWDTPIGLMRRVFSEVFHFAAVSDADGTRDIAVDIESLTEDELAAARRLPDDPACIEIECNNKKLTDDNLLLIALAQHFAYGFHGGGLTIRRKLTPPQEPITTGYEDPSTRVHGDDEEEESPLHIETRKIGGRES